MDPAAFALFVVGFSDVDSDRALAVAGQWQWSEGRVGQKTKTERGPLLPRHAINRQAETHQSVNDAAFGRFELAPALPVARHPKIGNQLIEPAGGAERIRLFDGHQPVADLVLFIVAAAAIEPSRCGRCKRPPPASRRRL